MLDKKALPQRALTLWRVRATLFLIAAAFFCGVLLVFSTSVAVVFGIVALLIYLIFVLLYSPLLYKSYMYSFSEDQVLIQKGVLFCRNVRIRWDRVQYCVLVQGPLQRLFGVASVMILTSGSRELIRDIHVKNAEKLRKALIQNENE